MALSQLQCLDDNHVNLRTNESKPEFLYCEDQRLALEALLRDGREAFLKYLGAHGLRGFLSDPELEALSESIEPYDPGSELFPENAEDDEPQTPLSLHYWPERSDTSIPQMDLGWPDCAAYRGVTRATVYTQPPLEGETHIKEVVRKMIAQAQKVIAVVMDVFTDVDIFRDLLDAGFKRKVSVYILLERTTLPHFQSMCQRANMHAGHLKHLRVRCTDGAKFYTRSCTKVTGRMGHRFMFVDGDKAVSGSYSFTWMSSRLDKNLITVVTGQAVEAFDRLFRILYASSSSVNLRQVATEPGPEPEPLPQLATVLPPSAAIARKLYSPKYALVTLGNTSPALSADRKDTQSPEVSKDLETKKQRQERMSKEQEAPPIHPGLIDLEKACLLLYLPTWPEPDPPSDVIGFINIRDAKKPTQVHLQRSEMFETSQAIRFSSPITMPKETLPDVAKPRQLTAKHGGMNKRQPAQDETTKAKELLVGRAQATELSTGPGDIRAEAPAQKSPASRPKCESDRTKVVNAENKLHSNTPYNQDAHTPLLSSSKASTPHTAATFPGSNSKKEADTEHRVSILESNSSQTKHLRAPTDWNSNTEPHTQTKTHTHSHTQAVHTQPQHSSEITPDTQTPAINSHTSSSLTSATCSQSAGHTALSVNSHVSITTDTTTNACSPLSSISSSSSIPPLTSSSTTPNPSFLTLTSTPPIPKPRTVQLVIKGSVAGDSQKLPEFSVVRKCETEKQTSLENVPQTTPEQNSRSKTGTQKGAKNTLNFREAPQQKQSGTSQERKNEEADERYERAGMQSAAGNKAKSDDLITNEQNADSGNLQERIPKDMEPKTLTLTPPIDAVATVQSEIKSQTGCEFSEVSNEKTENETYLARAHTPQRISHSESQDIDALETVDSPTHAPISATHISKDTQGQHGNPSSLIPAHHTDSMPNSATQNTHQELSPKTPRSKPKRSLRLHLPDKHVPELRSPTPDKESQLLAALTRTPTPEGFRPHTPDSQTHTPDLRSHTPDFRTPTSDGYVSSRTDSALSTTSEEYYECSDSPFHDPVFDQAALRNHGTKEHNVSITHINTPNNGVTNTASPECTNSSSTKDRNTSSSDAQSLSGSDRVSSPSSLLNDEKGRRLSVAEKRTVGQYQGTERRGSDDAKRSSGTFKQQRVSTETEDKDKEAQTQAPKRKKVLNHTAAERPASGGEITNERAEPKRLSRGDLQSKMASSEKKKPEKEKAADRVALGPSSVERRGRPPSPRETDNQKLLHTSPKSQRGQQQDSPSRPSRPLPANQVLGSRPFGTRQLTQAERKVLHGSLLSLDNTSSPRQPPSRPPPPVTAAAAGLAADRKQSDLSRQPLAAQGRIRPGLSQNQHRYPKPNSSFLHTHSNKEAQAQPYSNKQKASPQEEHWEEEGRTPFSFTFSKLYSLKGLKDKMSRLPASTKRGSASSPGPVRKSTS